MLYVPTALSNTIQHAIHHTHTSHPPHTHTPHPLTQPYPNPTHTNLSPNLPSITLPLDSLPCLIQPYHSQPQSISLLTSTNPPSTITVTLQLPKANSTTITLPLPYHYPTIDHLLLTILLFYPPY
ncbi:CPA_1a_G0000040.mRNA.1.CDS.1 [Saccharomyces cerevisiae]|nr:CPA_1a_G0000040.mRNA.1.CDS.1 [Saccharomyces cerevisiae]CAI7122788.1 CPA_1a_G0000040.mRNA.1.CDS.1 [Saccharomyces cerevisiae]